MTDNFEMVYLLTLLFGLFIGSFLNVCIYRLPRVHLTLTAESLVQLQHEPIPPEIMATLKELQDHDYATEKEFLSALENALGENLIDQYASLILKHASTRRESIVYPASHCPHCHVAIKPWDNIPVFSYILLRGKCRVCHASISGRYPVVESLTALLFIAIIHQFSIEPEAFVYLILISALIVISFIDLDHQIIPDVISLPGIAVGIMASFMLPLRWYDSALGALVGGGLILAVGYLGSFAFKKEAMGGGDVKLMAMIGAFLGWKLALLTIFFGSLTGAVVGSGLKLITGKDYIPFGPFLSLGALIALFFGQQLLAWYLHLASPPL